MKNNILISGFLVVILFSYSCRKEVFVPKEDDSNRPEDWTTETHSNNIDPNYGIVFNQTKVNKIHIVFTSQEWADMQSDLATVKSGGYKVEPA